MSVHADPPPSIVSEPHGINYATANQLGKGGFAICFKAERLDREQPTGHLVALKIVKSRMEPAKLAQKFITELQIHSKLSHPNIVAFHRAFSFGESTYVVLELCSSGSLADMLKRRKNITMPEIRRFIIQVSGAVKYLHARNIVHRDLKTGNLFLDEKMNIKVGDFGLAALLVSGKDMDAKRRTTMCGTPNYLAPEILEKGKGHSEKVDLWAIGIIAYTLAVGRAPFHASSKEEIYKKLKAGDYSWPELSSITNEISADLRNLVSSLLVAEELRPCPDQIVSHPFFRLAHVPRHMSRAQTHQVPSWPNAQPPSPEVLQRGYTDSWWYVCKESGVGEYAPGKCFQLNAGKKVRSIVRDIEREVAAGRQPVIPIPSDTVYTSPNSTSIDAFQPRNALPEIAEEGEPETRQLREIAHNEVQPVARESSTDDSRKKDTELMPPPPRVRRAGPIRKTRTATDEKEEIAPESTRQSTRLNSQTVFSGTSFVPSSSQPQSGEIIPVSKRSADASLARRPRGLRKNLSEREIPALADAIRDDLEIAPQKPLATRSSRSRPKQPTQEVIEIFDEQEKLGRPVLPPPPVMNAKLPVPRRKTPTSTSAFAGSNPQAVLERLCVFRSNLASALDKKHLAPSRRIPQQPTKPLPFVSRWVDYSKKHGVGYVLDDGTVGCVINASAASGTPVTHVAVKNGERWLARIGKRFEYLEKVPFKIFEDNGSAGLERLDLGTKDEGTRERLRMLRVLWVKFGRYMSQTLNGTEVADSVDDEAEADSNLLFVRFYQRSGNVGIWGFSDGCVQLHFPDHTKFVLSADGLHTSATLVPVEGVRAIEENHDLPTKLLRDRQTLVHSIHALLYGSQAGRGQKLFAEMVQANMVEEKMQLLVQVLDQWIAGGGLGCVGGAEERLQWQGSWVNEHARKIDWVTVGRLGGDEIRS